MDDVTATTDPTPEDAGELELPAELQAELDTLLRADSHSDDEAADDSDTGRQDGDAEGESEGDEEGDEATAPTLESALEKRAAMRRGENHTLTAEEQRLLDSYDQAQENSRRDRLANETRRQQALEGLKAAYSQAEDQITAALTAIADKATEKGLDLNDEFIQGIAKSTIQPILNGLQTKAEEVWREPELERQRQRILGAFGETVTPELRTYLGGLKTQDDLNAYLYELGRATGKMESVGEDQVVIAKSEYDEMKRALDNASADAKKTPASPQTRRPAQQPAKTRAKEMGWQEMSKAIEDGELDFEEALKEFTTA